MKTPIIPEQHWINKPDAAELERLLVKRDRLIVVLMVVAMCGWAWLAWLVFSF